MFYRRSSKQKQRGFSLVEILFAILILGIGVMGILALFIDGISSATWSGNHTSAAMEAQSLLARIMSQEDPNDNPPPGVAQKRIFLEAIRNSSGGDIFTPGARTPGYKYIQGAGNASSGNNTEDPVLVYEEGTKMWWRCRVSNMPMHQKYPQDPTLDETDASKMYAFGLFQVCIEVWKNYDASSKTKPLAVYTTLIHVSNPPGN